MGLLLENVVPNFNNDKFLKVMILRSRILALLSDDHHDLERKYEDWIESEMQQYELWHKPLTDVMIETNRGKESSNASQ